MEKVNTTTPSILDENVERLAKLFPEVVTEVREADGTLRHTIDVDALKERVGDVAEEGRERYQFTWPGKRESKQEAYRVIDKCFRPYPEESVNWDTTENLYIEGDNLDALKLLRNTYAGKIKMIYIDPPYNTGHDFIYDDNFAQSRDEYDAENGDYDEAGGRLVANPESNGRFHSDWCSMMYPRLLLARDLLSEDGVIFISIDDGEVKNARELCDLAFGVQCFAAQFIWKSRQNKDNRNKTGISIDHEYVLVYTKSSLSRAVRGEERNLSAYRNPDNDPRGPWTSGNMVGLLPESQRPNCHFDLINPATGINYGRPKLGWRYDKAGMQSLIDKNLILWPDSPSGRPRRKKFLSELKEGYSGYSSIICRDVYTRNGTTELDSLFDARFFDFPKPVEVVYDLLSQASRADSIILDFFSGSATTAHAVMKLNAEDGGNRKFIMVQLPEVCEEGSEAAKAGYKNICEIGEERIRRAGKKISAEIEEANKNLKHGEAAKRVPDIGFRVFKIDSSNFEDVKAEPNSYQQQALLGLVDNLKDGRTEEDILFQVLPQFQIPLSAPIEVLDIDGSKVFSVDGGRLVACFDKQVSTACITEMAKMNPDYAVMRDASFTSDDAVSNFDELFKIYSPATITRVI